MDHALWQMCYIEHLIGVLSGRDTVKIYIFNEEIYALRSIVYAQEFLVESMFEPVSVNSKGRAGILDEFPGVADPTNVSCR